MGLLSAEDGRLQWRHALTREAVLASLLPPERIALAARTARVLDKRDEPRDRVAAAELFVAAGHWRPRSSSSSLVTMPREALCTAPMSC